MIGTSIYHSASSWTHLYSFSGDINNKVSDFKCQNSLPKRNIFPTKKQKTNPCRTLQPAVLQDYSHVGVCPASTWEEERLHPWDLSSEINPVLIAFYLLHWINLAFMFETSGSRKQACSKLRFGVSLRWKILYGLILIKHGYFIIFGQVFLERNPNWMGPLWMLGYFSEHRKRTAI